MVKKDAHVKIDVFSVTGQHIKTLVDGRKSSGTHQLRFRGGNLAGGIYFYRMFINGRLQETKKMLLLKIRPNATFTTIQWPNQAFAPDAF